MQLSSPVVDYRVLDGRLAVSVLGPSAAEAHGILCAMLCAGGSGAEESWIAELLAGADETDLLAQECRLSLQELAKRTREELTGSQIGFTPMLPDDSAPLAERASGLYDWSRGFLYGLGLSGMDASRLSDPVREAFGDFVSITRLDLDELEDSEENERALMELVEFVRVAVLLIYEERIHAAGSPG
jgi:yecA family protein